MQTFTYCSDPTKFAQDFSNVVIYKSQHQPLETLVMLSFFTRLLDLSSTGTTSDQTACCCLPLFTALINTNVSCESTFHQNKQTPIRLGQKIFEKDATCRSHVSCWAPEEQNILLLLLPCFLFLFRENSQPQNSVKMIFYWRRNRTSFSFHVFLAALWGHPALCHNQDQSVRRNNPKAKIFSFCCLCREQTLQVTSISARRDCWRGGALFFSCFWTAFPKRQFVFFGIENFIRQSKSLPQITVVRD